MLNLSNGDLFTNSSEGEKELLVLYIEIAEGNTQILTVHHGENVQELVDKFCEDKELTVHAKTYIIEEVEKSLQYFYPSNPLPESIDQEITSDLQLKIQNKGVELYLRGQKMKEKAEQKREKFRKEQKILEDKHITLRPSINKSPQRSKKPEVILLEKGRKTAESLQRKRTIIEEKFKTQCTFSPEINKNNTKRSPSRFKQLYENARDIQSKLQKKSEKIIQSTCPFEPNFTLTKKKTEKILKNFSKTETCGPSTNASPAKVTSNSPSPKLTRFSSPVKTSKEKSDRLFANLKSNRFLQIFQELLPNNKGIINKETVYKAKFENSVRRVLRPILDKIENEDENLDLNQFLAVIEGLFKTMPVVDRAALLKTQKKAGESSSRHNASRSVSSDLLSTDQKPYSKSLVKA